MLYCRIKIITNFIMLLLYLQPFFYLFELYSRHAYEVYTISTEVQERDFLYIFITINSCYF